METWRAEDFKQQVADIDFIQDNHSKSGQGVLRGLHYQIQHPQGKLVRVVLGEAFDVAVDIREQSPTFGRWVGTCLNADNKEMLWVPPGFAHGFYVLSAEVELIYKCTDYYFPEYDRSIKWDDPDIGINWPLLNGEPPVLSEKDQHGQAFKTAEVYP